MFDSGISADAVRAWVAALGSSSAALDDVARIDLIRALEDLKSAASARQARESVLFDASQREAQRLAGVPADRRGLGVGAQVALARRESPSRGGRFLGLARALVDEMPRTLAALADGTLSEWRATLLARESACLSREDRATLDREVAGDAETLVGLGDRALVARARAVALRLDVAAVVARARRAEGERCVTLRPAPDTMTYLTALLPVAQGVALYGALVRAADQARAAGDPRGRGQVMADELVARIAHRAAGGEADSSSGSLPARLEVQLVMTDRTLLSGDDEPAHLPGYGTVPGPWARDLVLASLEKHARDERAPGPPEMRAPGERARDERARDERARDERALDERTSRPSTRGGAPGRAQVWVRRLFTAPTTGQLVAMDSKARLAPSGLAALIRSRDGTCRTPWCDAPVRHVDHVVPSGEGGPTASGNLQGLCEACNYAKQAPGWRAAPAPAPASRPPGATPVAAPDVILTTPTGHRYVSRAPALPGSPGVGLTRQGPVEDSAGDRDDERGTREESAA